MGRIASAGHADYVREEETVGLETVPYAIECPTSKADIALESVASWIFSCGGKLDVPQRAYLTQLRPSVYTVKGVALFVPGHAPDLPVQVEPVRQPH